MRRELHEDNRISWNDATKVHNSHKADQARFLREGGSTLFPEEIELLGDITGKTLLHLQCNAGQDTLSLARRGAVVTGVDISDEAIGFATQLAADTGIPGIFERSDVYDWLSTAVQQDRQFDVVFSSYGAVIWLSDLASWAAGIARILRPGGHFVLVEFHPVIGMLNDQWQVAYPYGGGDHLAFEHGIGDYVAWAGQSLAPSGYLEGVTNYENPYASHEFTWGLADVVNALVGTGLHLEVLVEYPYANGFPGVSGTVEGPGGRFAPPADRPRIPMMYGLRVRK